MKVQRGRPNPLDGRCLRVHGFREFGHFSSALVVQFVEGGLHGMLPLLCVVFRFDLVSLRDALALETDLVNDGLGRNAVRGGLVADGLGGVVGLQVGVFPVGHPDPNFHRGPFGGPIEELATG